MKSLFETSDGLFVVKGVCPDQTSIEPCLRMLVCRADVSAIRAQIISIFMSLRHCLIRIGAGQKERSMW